MAANLHEMIEIKKPKDLKKVNEILARTGYMKFNGFYGGFIVTHFEDGKYWLAHRKSTEGSSLNDTERNALLKVAYQLEKWQRIKLLQPITRRPRSAVKTISKQEERRL